MLTNLIEEMKAKIAASVGMSLTFDETKEVLAALTSPETVAASAQGIEAKQETLPVAVSEPAESTETEPAEVAEQKGPLPEDFPGRHALAGAGINTFAQVRKARDSKEGLTGLTGVGDATAKAIEEALN